MIANITELKNRQVFLPHPVYDKFYLVHRVLRQEGTRFLSQGKRAEA